MNTMEDNKLDIFKILIIIFLISFFIIGLLSKYYENTLQINTTGLESIQYLSSQVQRVTKLELEDNYSNTLISLLNDAAIDLEQNKYFKKNQAITQIVQEYAINFNSFKNTLIEFRENSFRDLLFNASEVHYDLSILTIHQVQEHIDYLTRIINFFNKMLMVNLIIIAGLLNKVLTNTNYELHKSKKISSDMFIDISTGIYNHAKCNEILNNIINAKECEGRAIIVFKLRDLKKMNESDVAYFTKGLKEATKIFAYDVFVGRYDNNLFMVYFTETTKKDVKLYIKEIDFLSTEFNMKQAKNSKILYYLGYSIAEEENKLLSTQELFDVASFGVYKNKIKNN